MVFPTGKRMLPHLIDNGHYGQAHAIVEELLKKDPADVVLAREAVRLHLLEGLPDRAIDRLETINRLSPLPSEALAELALLYEWNRNPTKARDAWEAALEKDQQNETALIRLIDYYRYAGDLEKEGAVIVSLIHQRQASGQWQEDSHQLTDLIAAEIDKQGRNVEKMPSDPLLAMLVSGLYQLYEQGLDNRAIDATDRNEATRLQILRCLEQFVWTGYVAQGEAFANTIDHRWGTGITQQLQLVEVLRWNEMNRDALALLKRLHDQVPADRNVLIAMAETAAAEQDPTSGVSAYQALIRLEPAEPAHRQRLMSLYRQTGQSEAIFEYYRQQFYETKEPRLVPQLLALSMASGDDDMRETALALAARAETNTPSVLKQRADLYLVLNRPEAAYPLLKRMVAAPETRVEDVLMMIEVAGYTNRAMVMADALNVAEARMPDHPDLLKRIAEQWLAAARPENAYGTTRRLASIKGNDATDLVEALKMAGHTGDPRLIVEAIGWATDLAPDDPAVAEQALALYLAIGDTERAYDLMARRVRNRRAMDQVTSLVALAEATGQPTLLEDALKTALAIKPDDSDRRLQLARYYLGRGEELRAIDEFERYLHLRPADRVVRVQLAKLYEWQKQPQKALSIYRRLAETHPGDAAISDALARLMAETGDRAGTLKMLLQQADADPKNADLALAAGRALVAENRLEDGRSYLERAVGLAPAQIDIWQDLANVYEWTGKPDRLIVALQHLDDARRLDERQTILLAESYLNGDSGSDALRLLKAFENKNRLPHREGLMLAEAYEQIHRPEAARRIYGRLFDENRHDSAFLADLGDRALWRQHTDLALTVYEAVLQKDKKNPTALKGSGQIYAWNNNPKRAIDLLERYNRIFPDDYEAHYMLGELYFAGHRPGDAQKQFRKAMKLINTSKHPLKRTSAKIPTGRTQP